MRHGVALAVAVGLVITLPAAAREQAETKTVRVGQTVPLSTVFDKKTTYTIVMSGLVTLTRNDGGEKWTYDPFHGVQAQSCQNDGGGQAVNLQIKDKDGPVISVSDAYKPPLYRVPCRPDHRYEFQVNDGPVVSDLDGKATAYIPLQPDPRYWTASGSFRLQIKPLADPRRDVEFTVRATKEVSASARDELLADVRLSGSGRIVDLDGARQARGRLLLTVVWLTRDDTELTLKPIGSWRYNQKQESVGGSLQVVKSSERACRNRQMAITLGRTKKQRAYVRMADPSGCSGGKLIAWLEPESEVDLTIQEVLGK